MDVVLKTKGFYHNRGSGELVLDGELAASANSGKLQPVLPDVL